MRPRLPWIVGLLLAASAHAASPGNANYTIDVRLDHATRTLDGRQTLQWTNIRTAPADELRFHLYWNGFRNDRSTWMRGDRLRGRNSNDDPKLEDWGYLHVRATRLLLPGEPAVDLTDRQFFDAPDDGNRHDRTVLVVPLPAPVAPGESVAVEMEWRARVPRTMARTGFRGDFYFIAHWFPKLGVWTDAGWNCHQFHSGTEFFSDYGRYDVSITLPQGWVLGATGRLEERTDNDDGTTTHRHLQQDVHGFTWTTSPDYEVVEDTFSQAGLPSVDMRLLIQPEHRAQAERHLAASKAALETYGTWFGAYPYGHVTVVDPAYGSGAAGMEYPTLYTCGTRRWNPFGGDSPESVTIHEMGHQFWYGLVGNDEFNHAWIDEGLNTFSTLRTLDEKYPPRMHVRRYLLPPGETAARRGFFPLRHPDIRLDRWDARLERYRPAANTDDPSKPTYLQHPGRHGNITYSKTALWLRTLERHLGWDVLQPAMADFFEAHLYGHPEPEEFIAAVEARAGQDLSWFFDQVYRDAAVFDYAIDSIESYPTDPEGWVDGPPGGEPQPREREKGEETVYRSEVVVRRHGDGRFPLTVRLDFEDGTSVQRRWDGQARWTLLSHEGGSKIRSATVDPDRVLMLDVRPTNNTRFRKRQGPLPAVKWAGKWMLWLQDRLATFQFYL